MDGASKNSIQWLVSCSIDCAMHHRKSADGADGPRWRGADLSIAEASHAYVGWDHGQSEQGLQRQTTVDSLIPATFIAFVGGTWKRDDHRRPNANGAGETASMRIRGRATEATGGTKDPVIEPCTAETRMLQTKCSTTCSFFN